MTKLFKRYSITSKSFFIAACAVVIFITSMSYCILFKLPRALSTRATNYGENRVFMYSNSDLSSSTPSRPISAITFVFIFLSNISTASYCNFATLPLSFGRSGSRASMLSVSSVVTFVRIEPSKLVATIPICCSNLAICWAYGSDFVTLS